MYIRDYNKATRLYDTDAFIIDGTQETMFILASDLYESLIGNKGFVTDKELDGRDYLSRNQVNTLVEAKGYITQIQADKLITDKGYQTASQVDNLILAKGYQTSSDVNRIIEAKDFINSVALQNELGYYVKKTDLEAKGYQTASDVKNIVNNSMTSQKETFKWIVNTVAPWNSDNYQLYYGNLISIIENYEIMGISCFYDGGRTKYSGSTQFIKTKTIIDNLNSSLQLFNLDFYLIIVNNLYEVIITFELNDDNHQKIKISAIDQYSAIDVLMYGLFPK